MSSPGRSVPEFLFCYACRPNFHHKYLTLSDPPLSACGEALISRHTCADRPEILKLEPRTRAFSRVRVDALMHVGAKRRSTSSGRPTFFLFLPATLCAFPLAATHLAAGESHRCWRASPYLEDRLCCVSAHRPSLCQLPLVIGLGSDKERKASNTGQWGKYLSPLVYFCRISNIPRRSQGGDVAPWTPATFCF